MTTYDEELRERQQAVMSARAAQLVHDMTNAYPLSEQQRDPLDDASTELQRAIAEIHDLLREAKNAKNQSRQGAIYYRVVTLQGFLNALVIDARRDLDALKDLPL